MVPTINEFEVVEIFTVKNENEEKKVKVSIGNPKFAIFLSDIEFDVIFAEDFTFNGNSYTFEQPIKDTDILNFTNVKYDELYKSLKERFIESFRMMQ